MTCLQGASAVDDLLDKHADPNLRVFVVWEPVIATDVRAPSTRSVARVSDPRVRQYWDPERLLSKEMGEKDRATIVWDVINIYSADTQWSSTPPPPVFSDRPVVRVIDRASAVLAKAARP